MAWLLFTGFKLIYTKYKWNIKMYKVGNLSGKENEWVYFCNKVSEDNMSGDKVEQSGNKHNQRDSMDFARHSNNSREGTENSLTMSFQERQWRLVWK